MKRTFKYALRAVLGIGLVAPAFAQTDNFPDVNENHWAYEALARLKKDGLLVGYPDGLFRGTRPASRYELAVAIHAVYTNLRNVTDGLQSQIDALSKGSDKGDIQSLRDQVAALQSQVNALKGYGDDIANLKKLADTFQNELHALGVDVDQFKKDLSDLAKRVTALEARKPAVDISGDGNLFLAAANSSSGNYGMNKDGKIEGVLKNSAGGTISGNPTAGLTQDLSILHELALKFKGTNTTGPTWEGTVVYGNVLSNLGNESQVESNTPYSDTGTASFYLQDFAVKFNSSVAGLGFDAEAGRIGYKVGPYMFQRINPSSYYTTDRLSNGEYYLDGANLAFNLLGGKVNVFGGRTSNQIDSAGMDINPLASGPIGGTVLNINRTLGVDVTAPITSAGSLKVAYLWLDSAATPTTGQYQTFGGAQANRLEVYGGTLNFGLGVIKLQGDYAKSTLKLNSTTVNDKDADVWSAKASYGTSKWNIWGFYREIGANFAAPGDWGRIGIIRNPTNLKGETFGGDLSLSSKLVLKADYEHEQGKDNTASSFIGTGNKLDKYDVSLGYKFSNALDLTVGYEDDKFTGAGLSSTGDPHYKWTTFGIGYGLSDAAKLTLQYELSDINNEIVTSTARYKGGLLTSQLSIKF